jgi:hypothetical protein
MNVHDLLRHHSSHPTTPSNRKSLFDVLYYEMLVGMVAGSGVIYLLGLLRARARRDRAAIRRVWGLTVVGVVLPAAVFIGGRLLAIPAAQSNYTGTTVAFGPGALTTALHTTTPKYIDEIKEPGQVYLYYAVGVICVAILVSWAILALAPRAPSAARIIALVLLGMFLVVQVSLNWRLATESVVAFTPNAVLGGAAVSDTAPETDRCAALVGFAERPWPTYYRTAIVEDTQDDYRLAFGKTFCSDPAALARVTAANG